MAASPMYAKWPMLWHRVPIVGGVVGAYVCGWQSIWKRVAGRDECWSVPTVVYMHAEDIEY
jgi:hypothetical protein